MALWQKMKMGDFLTLEYGKPLDKAKRKDDGLYPAYGANGVKCWSDEYYYDQKTIIVGRKGSAGEITLTEERFWPLDVTYFIKFDDSEYDLMFVYYLLSCLNLPSLATGVKPGINRNNVYTIDVYVPEFPEQKHIVAILDHAFADIDKARANAQQNLNNARDLFESCLHAQLLDVCSMKPSQTLSCITELIVDCEHKTAPTQNEGFPSIRTPNIGQGELILENVKRVSQGTYELWTNRAIPNSGDLILAREAPAGNVGVIPEGQKVCLGQRTVLIRPLNGVVDSQYLAFLLLHPIMQNRLLAYSTGATVQHVNMKDIRQLAISELPEKNIQLTDVEILLNVKLQVATLEKVYLDKLDALSELKKSILQKAFTGELTKESKGVTA